MVLNYTLLRDEKDTGGTYIGADLHPAERRGKTMEGHILVLIYTLLR